MNINNAVLELETLRRRLESARSEAGMIDEAVERGWISKDQEEKNRVIQEKQNGLVKTLEPKLKELKTQHMRSKTMAVERWIGLHLQVCQNLLQAEIKKPNENSGVRTICIGDVLSQLGKMLGPETYSFWVNSHYLPDYEKEFNRIS